MTNQTQMHFFSIGNGDAILIQNGTSNILIDAGKERNKFRYNKMRNDILALLDNGESGVLDLVIVSHSDDDHIGGVLNMVVDEKIEPRIQKYIFHSENNIAKYLDGPYLNREKYPLSPVSKSSVKSNYRQDLALTQLLGTSKKWDGKIHIAGDTIPCSGAILTILSPTYKKLELLQKHWSVKKKEYLTKQGTVKSSSNNRCTFDYDTLLKDFDFETIKIEENKSAVNGASIAFVYEDENTKGLFLSDSHPSVIVQSLREFIQEGDCEIKFDFVKLSHHGSKNNLTKELLELIECENFIVTADANKAHCHPNKQTLALITQHYGEDKVKFYFSENNKQLDKLFEDETFSNYKFATTNDRKLTLTQSRI